MKKLLLVPLLLAFSAPSVFAFSDIYESDPLTFTAAYLQESDIIDGYDDGTFRPLSLINRAEFMKMIVEGVTGETPDEETYKDCFKDVADEWFAKYICYGEDQGWVEGYPDGDFKPAVEITRAEATKIIVNAFEWEENDMQYSSFYDIDMAAWYWEYMLTAESNGLSDTIDPYLSPHELISRRQFSELLYRAIKFENGEEFSVLSTDGTAAKTYEDWLAEGIAAAYPSNMEFPAHSQNGWPYGCYAFSVKNMTEWKYGEILDITEVQEQIEWDGESIWNYDEMTNFAEDYHYDIIMTYQASPEFLLKKLAAGEPVVLYIPYYLGEDNIGHQLVAYSFDENGVWVADSLSGGVRRQIGWDEVFVDGANYTLNVAQIKKLKDGGQYVYQYGL